MVFVGGRTSWTLIKWSTSLRINSSLVGAEIGTLQVAPASAQQIDGKVITSLQNGLEPKLDDSRADGAATEGPGTLAGW